MEASLTNYQEIQDLKEQARIFENYIELLNEKLFSLTGAGRFAVDIKEQKPAGKVIKLNA